jgi:cytochrome c oxidase cbb3-type subunit 4
MTHDAVLVFSKSWGAIYLLVFFLAAVVWTYWPSRKNIFDKAAKKPLQEDEAPWR